MEKNANLILVPGGFEELSLTSYKSYSLFLEERKGFIKYALEYGYKIIPTFTFNENKVYKPVEGMESVKRFFSKIKLAPGTLFYSKFLMVYPDPDQEIITIIGKPIELPQIQNPIQEIVDHYHRVFLQETLNLYYKYKGMYDKDSFLESFTSDSKKVIQ
jgi:2-acylglycerol O-acyltransferase 2